VNQHPEWVLSPSWVRALSDKIKPKKMLDLHSETLIQFMHGTFMICKSNLDEFRGLINYHGISYQCGCWFTKGMVLDPLLNYNTRWVLVFSPRLIYIIGRYTGRCYRDTYQAGLYLVFPKVPTPPPPKEHMWYKADVVWGHMTLVWSLMPVVGSWYQFTQYQNGHTFTIPLPERIFH